MRDQLDCRLLAELARAGPATAQALAQRLPLSTSPLPHAAVGRVRSQIVMARVEPDAALPVPVGP